MGRDPGHSQLVVFEFKTIAAPCLLPLALGAIFSASGAIDSSVYFLLRHSPGRGPLSYEIAALERDVTAFHGDDLLLV